MYTYVVFYCTIAHKCISFTCQ